MSIEKLVLKFSKLNIKLWVEEGKLRYKAPHGTMTSELIQELKDNKTLLLHYLTKTSAKSNRRFITPLDKRDVPLALSFAQQRLWFIDQLEEGSFQYNMPVALKLKGQLNLSALQAALDSLIERHESLRTTFINQEGEARQIIQKATRLDINFLDFTEINEQEREQKLENLVESEALKLFDLTKNWPIRASLVTLTQSLQDETEYGEYILLFTMHHIASDGWSMGLLVKEFISLYSDYSRSKSNSLAPLPIQYADFAHWQRAMLDSPSFKKQLDDLKLRLAGIPETHSLLCDKPRPAQQSFIGKAFSQRIDRTITDKLTELAKVNGASLFMLLQSAFAVLISRYSNEDDIVIGSPIAGRTHQELESLIGMFVNNLVFRTDLSNKPSFVELLAQNKKDALQAYASQSIPFELLVNELQPERSLSQSPVFQIVFVMQNSDQPPLTLPNLQIEAIERRNPVAKFDLEVTVNEGKDGISLRWLYAEDLFYQETVESWASSFEILLKGILDAPDTNVYQLPLLNSQTFEQSLLSSSPLKEFPVEKCIHEVFEGQVEKAPASAALFFESQEVTYAELNQRANRLAHYLVGQGVKPDTLVGICVERSVDMLVSILAILKAGGAYVPLDPNYPEQRLEYIVNDAELNLVLLQEQFLSIKAFDDINTFVVGDKENEVLLAQHSCDNLGCEELGLKPSNLAYVIYTSGSTGEPKGVLIEHRNVLRLFKSAEDIFDFSHTDVWPLFHSYAFDFSVWEIWGALLSGGKLIVVPKIVTRSPDECFQLLLQQGATILNQTPSAFKQFAEYCVKQDVELPMRHVIFGGEALDLGVLRSWFEKYGDQKTKFTNMYGITETTVHVTYKHLTYEDVKENKGQSVIGKPLPDLAVLLLNEQKQIVPIGAPGEIYVSGAGLARGYLGREKLNQERFVRNPFDKTQTLYRSGDLAYYLSSGDLAFLGRADQQVKIRGFRIELGEIEHALSRLSGVTECVVRAWHGEGSDKPSQLVGYIVTSDTDLPSSDFISSCREALVNELPDYMVPSAFVLLDALPLTNNGKVDYKALPAPDFKQSLSEYVPPSTDMERLLCELWQEVLGVERVGVKDNFFNLGGHSLLAVSLAHAVETKLDKSLPLRSILSEPTVAQQSRYLLQDQGEHFHFEQINPAPEDSHLAFPLSEIQQAYWLGRNGDFELGNIGTHSYVEFPVPEVDIERVQRTVNKLVQRHAMLRMVINKDGQQEILSSVPEYQIKLHDFSSLDETESASEFLALRNELSHQLFSGEQWPLFDIRVSRLNKTHAVLHYSMDMLVMDASSSMILGREFTQLYLEPDTALPPLNITFRDYILAEQKLKSNPIYEKAKTYWHERLGDFPKRPELPLARDPSQIEKPRFERRTHKLLPLQWQRLKDLAQSYQVTPTVLLLSCFGEILNRWVQSPHFALNLTLFNRLPFHPEVGALIGDFTSLTLMEMDYRETGTSFVSRLKKVQEQLWMDLEHRYYGGLEVQRALRQETSEPSSFPVVVTSTLGLDRQSEEKEDNGSDSDDAKAQRGYSITQTSQVWLDVQLSEAGGGVALQLGQRRRLVPGRNVG